MSVNVNLVAPARIELLRCMSFLWVRDGGGREVEQQGNGE